MGWQGASTASEVGRVVPRQLERDVSESLEGLDPLFTLTTLKAKRQKAWVKVLRELDMDPSKV